MRLEKASPQCFLELVRSFSFIPSNEWPLKVLGWGKDEEGGHMIRFAFQIYLIKYEVRCERERNGCEQNWSLVMAFSFLSPKPSQGGDITQVTVRYEEDPGPFCHANPWEVQLQVPRDGL